MTTFYTFRHEEGIEDVECPTAKDCYNYATQWLADQCEDAGLRNYESVSRDVTMIAFTYDDELNQVILQEMPLHLVYEEYHGDYAEHNTMGM